LSQRGRTSTENEKQAEAENQKSAPIILSPHNPPPVFTLAKKSSLDLQLPTMPALAEPPILLWSHSLYDIDHTGAKITYAWPAGPQSVRPFAGLPVFYTISTRIQDAG